MKRRVNRLHEMRAKWGDCYWKPGDDEHYPGEHRCEELEADLIEFENDVRADFVDMLAAAPRAEGLPPEALDWARQLVENEGGDTPIRDAFAAGWDAARSTPAEALDVERLARAIEIEDDRLPFLDGGIDSTASPRAVAEQIAERYARLRSLDADR